MILIATSVVFASAGGAEPAPDPDKQCKKGWVRASDPGGSFDDDGNGWVCVDPATGEIRDDKGQFAGEQGSPQSVDENQNGLVCWSPTTGVVTDDDPAAEFPCTGDSQAFPTAVCCPEPFLTASAVAPARLARV